MTANRTPVRDVIDAISRDSYVIDSASKISRALGLLYPRGELIDAIEELLNDETWSSDNQPYVWLESVYRLI